MRRVLKIIPVVVIGLAGCSFSLPQPTTHPPEQTWLAVHGPRDWIPSETMSLEIDDAAWSITPLGGGGVVTPDLTDQASVRLIGLETCREYASFDIIPGCRRAEDQGTSGE